MALLRLLCRERVCKGPTVPETAALSAARALESQRSQIESSYSPQEGMRWEATCFHVDPKDHTWELCNHTMSSLLAARWAHNTRVCFPTLPRGCVAQPHSWGSLREEPLPCPSWLLVVTQCDGLLIWRRGCLSQQLLGGRGPSRRGSSQPLALTTACQDPT